MVSCGALPPFCKLLQVKDTQVRCPHSGCTFSVETLLSLLPNALF